MTSTNQDLHKLTSESMDAPLHKLTPLNELYYSFFKMYYKHITKHYPASDFRYILAVETNAKIKQLKTRDQTKYKSYNEDVQMLYSLYDMCLVAASRMNYFNTPKFHTMIRDIENAKQAERKSIGGAKCNKLKTRKKANKKTKKTRSKKKKTRNRSRRRLKYKIK